jgi:glycosyltransferase involved in cell wall biosynthesis
MTDAPRNRIAWAGAWSRAHNNARYEELLPRLSNVDKYYVDMHPWWPVRGLRRRLGVPLLMVWMGIRYPLVFSTDWRMVRLIRNRVVVDHDDPLFRKAEIRAMNAPNVEAIVVTSDSVKRRLMEAGLRNPVYVMPQGVAIPPADGSRPRAIRAEWRRSSAEVVVGFHQPRLAFSNELPAEGAQQMYAVDTLLGIMARARRREPRLILWLVGEPSRNVRDFAGRNAWVRLLGYKRRAELMDCVAAFDIGVYPRTLDLMGRASIKVLEYMACGVPVIGFDVEEMRPVLEARAGLAVKNPRAFSSALVSLAADRRGRTRMGGNGRKAVRPFSWDVLALRYRGLLEKCLQRRNPKG